MERIWKNVIMQTETTKCHGYHGPGVDS